MIILSDKTPILSAKYDVIFRLLFADERNAEDLINLLKSIIDLPNDDYDDIEISDPHLLPDYIGDKLAIIDVKLRTKSRKIIHIDIQLKVNAALKNRVAFYNAKLITEQIGSGDQYEEINKVISIIITEEILIPSSQRYHHRFKYYDADAGVEITDLTEIYTIELNKLPQDTDGTELYDWAKFIAAETEEELEMITKRNPQVGRTAVKLRKLSADEQARDMFERREKGLRDYNTALSEAEKKGKQEGVLEIARKLIESKMPIEEIIKFTSLTREQVEALPKTDEKK